ncbi:MAG: gamma carbonic anhydrase family protein [Burkholderiales bacterium]|nr:gamma carbonic anhydrase family protein [Burkholderiales bacterium]
MPRYRIADREPRIAATAFVADEATLIGAVTVGERASIWPGAVIRADNEPIRIGNESSVQEGAVLHADPGFPIVIEDRVTVGHQAMLHGCTIGRCTLIGMKATVMNGAVIGENSIVGAGALVTEGKQFPPRSLIVGVPGKLVRELGEADIAGLENAADVYAEKAVLYTTKLVRLD